ncbi:uncharacterized protein LOC111400280 [Olea europaea var. sylvestris]|uniref:uncharacterized protein LOC111400280 n=1 Tax=Olea europaea var. sylvestris TaxID=158386 RepID=UPI000C1D3CB2|nr:uncharacterized protein LOC111400280 [Olea europaea var. sylvestris]
MKETQNIKDYAEKLPNIVNKVRLLGKDFPDERIALEQSRLMRQEETVQGVFHAKAQNSGEGKDKKYNKKYKKPENSTSWKPRKRRLIHHVHIARKKNPQRKCSWRPDIKCRKCEQTGHMQRICRSQQHEVKGKETVAIKSLSGLKYITDVLYVLDIDQNLLSVGQLIEKSFKVIFEDKWCMIKDAKCRDVFKVKMRAKSFSLNLMAEEQTAFPSRASNEELWHFHHTGLLYMQKHNLVKGYQCWKIDYLIVWLVNMANKLEDLSLKLHGEQHASFT